MFGSTKELLKWIVGLSVAGDHDLGRVLRGRPHHRPHDPTDPLTSKGGLDRQQGTERK
jgi:hypothetical protein